MSESKELILRKALTELAASRDGVASARAELRATVQRIDDWIGKLSPRSDRSAERLLTIRQIAVDLDVSEKLVRGYIQDGELRCIDVGRGCQKRRLRVKVADRDEFIKKREGGAKRCQSIETPGRRSTGLIFGTRVVAFSALQRERTGEKQKP